MHEMALVRGIIDICQQHAAGRQVLALEVEIGELGGVVAEALEFCFEACSKETVLEGARLSLIQIAGTGLCQECGALTPINALFSPCGSCGSYQVVVQSGEELRVRSIEVED